MQILFAFLVGYCFLVKIMIPEQFNIKKMKNKMLFGDGITFVVYYQACSKAQCFWSCDQIVVICLLAQHRKLIFPGNFQKTFSAFIIKINLGLFSLFLLSFFNNLQKNEFFKYFIQENFFIITENQALNSLLLCMLVFSEGFYSHIQNVS